MVLPSVVLASWGALAGCRTEAGPSFVLISMDTLRYDRVGSRDARGVSRTPALDRFNAEALVFNRAFSQGNETLFSHASLFMGDYPFELGPPRTEEFLLPPDGDTLAARLSRAGWATEAVVAGGHLCLGFNLEAGFQRYTVMTNWGSFQETVPMARVRLEEISAEGRPFFLFLHGYDAHMPYVKPGPLFRLESPGYDGPYVAEAREALFYESIQDGVYYEGFFPPSRTSFGGNSVPVVDTYDILSRYAANHPDQARPLAPEDIAFLLGAYDAAVTMADYHVGVFLEALAAQGLDDQTYVIIMSDHGEDLMAHGVFNHRATLHDENTHVYLAVRGPGIEPGVRTDPVALLDVMPTILALAGLDAEDAGRGRPLLGAPDPTRAIFTQAGRGQKSVRTAQGRLIVPLEADPRVVLAGPTTALDWIGDDDNQPLPWTDPLVADLVDRMLEVAP